MVLAIIEIGNPKRAFRLTHQMNTYIYLIYNILIVERVKGNVGHVLLMYVRICLCTISRCVRKIIRRVPLKLLYWTSVKWFFWVPTTRVCWKIYKAIRVEQDSTPCCERQCLQDKIRFFYLAIIYNMIKITYSTYPIPILVLFYFVFM